MKNERKKSKKDTNQMNCKIKKKENWFTFDFILLQCEHSIQRMLRQSKDFSLNVLLQRFLLQFITSFFFFVYFCSPQCGTQQFNDRSIKIWKYCNNYNYNNNNNNNNNNYNHYHYLMIACLHACTLHKKNV